MWILWVAMIHLSVHSQQILCHQLCPLVKFSSSITIRLLPPKSLKLQLIKIKPLRCLIKMQGERKNSAFLKFRNLLLPPREAMWTMIWPSCFWIICIKVKRLCTKFIKSAKCRAISTGRRREHRSPQEPHNIVRAKSIQTWEVWATESRIVNRMISSRA